MHLTVRRLQQERGKHSSESLRKEAVLRLEGNTSKAAPSLNKTKWKSVLVGAPAAVKRHHNHGNSYNEST